MDPLSFSLEYAIESIPTPQASHSSSKVFEKFESLKIGAWVNLSLRVLKEFSGLSSHKKGISFFTSSLRGATMVENF